MDIKKEKSFEFLANVLIDTTYFGRTFGVMVFKNSLSKEVLLKYYVKVETNKHSTMQGLRKLLAGEYGFSP